MFKRLFGTKEPVITYDPKPVAPLEPVQVIGDIHGRMDLLERLQANLEADITTVYVGDFIDRGEESAQVLSFLHERKDMAICLMGNHEKMMLDFIANPVERGQRWLRYGGLQTLASFGVGGVTENADGDDLIAARDTLLSEMPTGLLEWLRNLPLFWESGSLVVTHAALDPEMPISQKDSRTMLWGNSRFMQQPRRDDYWVAHGHTVVDQPTYSASRIAVDTGAYYTNILTVARIEPDGTVGFSFA